MHGMTRLLSADASCASVLSLSVSHRIAVSQLDEHFLAIAVEAAALPAALHRHSQQQHPQPPCVVVCLATCCVCDACRTARTAQHIGSMRRGTVAIGQMRPRYKMFVVR